MNIVCLLGSPRVNGNSAVLAETFLDTARQHGAATETFKLNKLVYKGCQACYSCWKNGGKCIQKDDMGQVLEAVKQCDLLLLATPIYYGDISSQLKAFVDRTLCFIKPDYTSCLEPGKKAVWIISQQADDASQFADVFPRYDFFFKWYGFENHLLRALGVHKAGEVSERKDLLHEAEELARNILREEGKAGCQKY